MTKFLKFVLCIIFCLCLFFFFQTDSDKEKLGRYCAFCDSQVINAQKFYEDDLVLALYTHKPIFPGHALVIPKRHVERFENLNEEEIAQIGRVIKKINNAVEKVFGTSTYLLLQKNGREAGQSVPHVHFHYIPRQTGDRSFIKFMLKMYFVNKWKPISQEEMQGNLEKMRKAIALE
jgi:histidine triad (HIT) family protein